ncbi:Alpha/Beta hydrolase protein [Aspergillus avenaceus]|uniref:Alpha/Beta hydrolase protein n=1 Tax=Aspergillus avenaceus TaxID=36643 RepID=A0A5N6U4P9_ASPAV|nr:Alpha/Beta hydrolase protein [Aspergillus avenaceus]
MLPFALLFSLMGFSLIAARVAAGSDVSVPTLEALGCGPVCQYAFNHGQAKDRKMFGSDFDVDFYATASKFPDSQPGDLLKFETIDPDSLDVIAGLTAYRFQYTSRDLDGSPVPATGFIGVPYKNLRDGDKYQVIAYAHGTTGVFAGCSPSSTATLHNHTSWSLLVEQGYAIVAPDYAGLGNDHTTHKYLSFPAHANDLYYGMIAARKALPDLFTDEWMSVGHSQGGGAVWKLSESKQVKSGAAGKYMGTVALAPASKVYDMTLVGIDALSHAPDYAKYDLFYLSLALPFAIQRALPDMSRAPFAPALQNRTKIGKMAQACNSALMALGADLKPSDLFTSALQDNSDFQKWQDMVAPANGDKADEPIMIVQGSADTAVWPEITTASWKDSCRHGNEAHLHLYPGMKHSDVVAASSRNWLRFISERFAGKPVTGKCGNVNAESESTSD